MKQLKMHRALGGAPTFSVQWRSLGRSLLANAMRGRRSCGLRRVGAAQATASSPDTLLQEKNNFLERGSSEIPPLTL